MKNKTSLSTNYTLHKGRSNDFHPTLLSTQHFPGAQWTLNEYLSKARFSASCLYSHQFVRLRQVDCLSPGGQHQPGQHGKTSSLQNISWAWWHVPVVPATQVAEMGRLLKPGRWRLQWAKIISLHSNLGERMRLFSKKKKAVERTNLQRSSLITENTLSSRRTG